MDTRVAYFWSTDLFWLLFVVFGIFFFIIKKCMWFFFRVAGHPLAQNERCLHMFLQDPNIDKNYVPGKIRNTWEVEKGVTKKHSVLRSLNSRSCTFFLAGHCLFYFPLISCKTLQALFSIFKSSWNCYC